MLSMHIILSMVLFSFAMSVTPGPVNAIIIISGINYGFSRTIPFISGATVGFTALLIAIGYGLYQFLINSSSFMIILSWCGSLFIIYLGVKTIVAKSDISEVDRQSEIPTFIQGFMLQWMNPKAWLACISGIAMFASPYSDIVLIIFVVIYFFVCYLGLSIWGYAGGKASIYFKKGGRMKKFNILMGFLLIFSAISMILSMYT